MKGAHGGWAAENRAALLVRMIRGGMKRDAIGIALELSPEKYDRLKRKAASVCKH